MSEKSIDGTAYFITNKGERVRSKSELNIANLLNKYNIPYKYEMPYVLSTGKVIYPDFAVLNVKRRKIIYWEHFGMMDDKEYAKKSVFKSKMYVKEGMFMGDRLVVTYETSTMPLGTDEIEKIITHHFLT